MKTRPVYIHFFVMKSYEEMLNENDYNTEIRNFIHNVLSKIGKGWVVRELETIFRVAYWVCGSLSHDFRKYDHYSDVMQSLPNHRGYIKNLTKWPEAMDTVHAIVYLMLTHDINIKIQEDIDNAIGSIKDKRIATAIVQFSMENKKKYHYDYSISIDCKWDDEEIEEWMDGYWSPDIAAKKIFSFVSYFDEEDREGMVNRANSAVRKLHSKWNTYLDSYEIDEYNKELSKYLIAGIEAGELERKDNKKVEKQVSNEEIDTIHEGKYKTILNHCTIHTYIENQYVGEQRIKKAPEDGDIQTEIPESVNDCFRFANGFVEECVKNIVKDFYTGRNIDMAMIEVVLFDHGLLKKRNNHKAFVRALLDWGILPADTEIMKLSNGMATKLKSPFPEEGYKSWDNYYLNDRTLCIAIGEKLPDSIKYMR